MAEKAHELTVSLSLNAQTTLDQIWVWNAEHYGVDHADRYMAFLQAATDKLATEYRSGKPVPTRPAFSYIVIRRRRKGHGHLAVYEVVGDVVHVLDYFHTAQDWQTRIAEEER